MGDIELAQRSECLFKRSSHPPERSGRLLGDLIVENVDGGVMKARIAGHLKSIGVACATMSAIVLASSGGCQWILS
jgi:hypothetical protein